MKTRQKRSNTIEVWRHFLCLWWGVIGLYQFQKVRFVLSLLWLYAYSILLICSFSSIWFECFESSLIIELAWLHWSGKTSPWFTILFFVSPPYISLFYYANPWKNFTTFKVIGNGLHTLYLARYQMLIDPSAVEFQLPSKIG